MINNKEKNLKSAATLSLIILSILFIYSFIFYKERFFCDYSFILFNIINSQQFQIQVERYGSFITQMVPLFLSKWHAPLQVILIGYSISFTLFPLLTALILYKLKQYDLVIFLGFYFTLYVSDTFFWTNNELHQAITWMSLLYGLLRSTMNQERSTGVKILALVPFSALAFLTIFTHPIVIIPFMFLWIFWWIDDKNFLFKSKAWPAVYLASVLGILIYKYKTSAKNGYDGASISKLEKMNLQDILNTFDSGMADALWHGWISNYWFILPLFITSISILIYKKKYLQASWVILANLGFFILVCLTFSELSTFHLESELMPFSIMAAAGFIYYALPELSKRQTVFVMIVIFTTRLLFISISSDFFVARSHKVDLMLDYMHQINTNKMIVKIREPDQNLGFIQSWSMPAESIYHSKLKGQDTAKTIIFFNERETEAYKNATYKTGILYPFAGFYHLEQINYFYFNVDTASAYKIVNYEDIIPQ